MQFSLQKIQHSAQRFYSWRSSRFNQALVHIEKTYLDIQQNKKTTWRQVKEATKAMLRINLYNTDLYFLIGGMALLVFTTRAFTEPGVDYGPWRPVVIGLAALLAGLIPMAVSIVLFPLHLTLRANTWALTGLNIVLSANIFAFVEPVIPYFFYNEGILGYRDLILGMLVFYGLALGYLQLRLNEHYCFSDFLQRHKTHDLCQLIPADKRGDVITLSAQDHYVEITTENGQHLSRMSMKEAVAMLPKNTGIHLHRSHWVAYSAILDMKKSAGKHVVLLRNGAKIPVAKAKAAEVRAYLNSG